MFFSFFKYGVPLKRLINASDLGLVVYLRTTFGPGQYGPRGEWTEMNKRTVSGCAACLVHATINRRGHEKKNNKSTKSLKYPEL